MFLDFWTIVGLIVWHRLFEVKYYSSGTTFPVRIWIHMKQNPARFPKFIHFGISSVLVGTCLVLQHVIIHQLLSCHLYQIQNSCLEMRLFGLLRDPLASLRQMKKQKSFQLRTLIWHRCFPWTNLRYFLKWQDPGQFLECSSSSCFAIYRTT